MGPACDFPGWHLQAPTPSESPMEPLEFSAGRVRETIIKSISVTVTLNFYFFRHEMCLEDFQKNQQSSSEAAISTVHCNLWGNCNPPFLAVYPPPKTAPHHRFCQSSWPCLCQLAQTSEPLAQKGHPADRGYCGREWGSPPQSTRKSNKSHLCNQADQPSVTAPKLGSGGAVLHPMKSTLTLLATCSELPPRR